jgi:hypothetical protein
MLMGDELRAAIRAAYEEARERGAAEDPPETIPEWDVLTLGMRLAFLHVYAAGRQLGAKEERKRLLGVTDQG